MTQLKPITIAMVLVLASMPLSAETESKEEKIARAMSAAPARISADATIIDVDGALLRDGANGWTCMPGVSLIPGDKHPMCNDKVWMEWMQAAAEGKTFIPTEIGFSYMLGGDAFVHNDNPAPMPDEKGLWYSEGPHLMLLLPSPDLAKSITNNPMQGPSIMWGETPMWHIMVPIGEMDKLEAKN